jgi:hypothetical protein
MMKMGIHWRQRIFFFFVFIAVPFLLDAEVLVKEKASGANGPGGS